jgi:hypothetical protein
MSGYCIGGQWQYYCPIGMVPKEEEREYRLENVRNSCIHHLK